MTAEYFRYRGMGLLGLFTAVWGLWLINPFTDVFDRAPIYSAMGDFMPETAWGFYAMASGAALLIGSWKKRPPMSMWGSRMGVLFWGLSCFMFAMGDFKNPAFLTCAFLSFLSYDFYHYVRTYSSAELFLLPAPPLPADSGRHVRPGQHAV